MKTIADQLDFDFSRRIDIQRNIDLNVINDCIKKFIDSNSTNLFTKHLRLLVIELYLCWVESDLQFLSVSMSKRGYNSKSRYNPNNISSYLIKTINFLNKKNLIELYPGFYDARSKKSRLTRIKPSALLKSYFKKIELSVNDRINHRQKESLLIYEKGNLTEYNDTYDTQEKKVIIQNYNNLITKTLFDIPDFELDYLTRGDNKKIVISRFTSSTYSLNIEKSNYGIFGGCWWNMLDLNLCLNIKRKMIINNQTTSYLDLVQFFDKYLTSKSNSNIDFESHAYSKYFNNDQLCYLIIKGSKSKNELSFLKSVFSEKKKNSLDSKDKKEIYDQVTKTIINNNNLRGLIFKEKDIGWEAFVSKFFFKLIKKICNMQIPIFLLRDKIYFPADKESIFLAEAEKILLQHFQMNSLKITSHKASELNFEKKSFFGRLLKSPNKTTKRYLANKNYFGIK